LRVGSYFVFFFFFFFYFFFFFFFFFALGASFFLLTLGGWLAETVARVRSMRTRAIVSSRT